MHTQTRQQEGKKSKQLHTRTQAGKKITKENQLRTQMQICEKREKTFRNLQKELIYLNKLGNTNIKYIKTLIVTLSLIKKSVHVIMMNVLCQQYQTFFQQEREMLVMQGNDDYKTSCNREAKITI